MGVWRQNVVLCCILILIAPSTVEIGRGSLVWRWCWFLPLYTTLRATAYIMHPGLMSHISTSAYMCCQSVLCACHVLVRQLSCATTLGRAFGRLTRRIVWPSATCLSPQGGCLRGLGCSPTVSACPWREAHCLYCTGLLLLRPAYNGREHGQPLAASCVSLLNDKPISDC